MAHEPVAEGRQGQDCGVVDDDEFFEGRVGVYDGVFCEGFGMVEGGGGGVFGGGEEGAEGYGEAWVFSDVGYSLFH